MTSAFGGTGRPYLQISGEWIYGSNTAITESSALNAPPMVAWKPPIEDRVLGAKDMRGVAVRARDELDWDPSHPSLTEEFLHGSYRR